MKAGALVLLIGATLAHVKVFAPNDHVFYLTDGWCTVGVTDNMCEIITKIKSESKKSAGKTYSVYTAMHVIASLQAHGMYPALPTTPAITSTVYHREMCHIYVINATDACVETVNAIASAYQYEEERVESERTSDGATLDCTLVVWALVVASAILLVV